MLPTGSGAVCTTEAMVLTCEALAARCEQPFLSLAGLRLFGGHSARVTGARALAACGLDVDKVRVLARHSGDTILRDVGESPWDWSSCSLVLWP